MGDSENFKPYSLIKGYGGVPKGPCTNMGVSENLGVPYSGVLIVRILLFRVY